MTRQKGNSKRLWRTVVLALVALTALIYGMIDIFEVPVRDVVVIALAAGLMVGAMMLLAAFVVALRWALKRML